MCGFSKALLEKGVSRLSIVALHAEHLLLRLLHGCEALPGRYHHRFEVCSA